MLKTSFAGKPFTKQLTIAAALGLFIALVLFLQQYPAFIERYYAEGLYTLICQLLHPLMNLIPFSFGDVLYVAAVGFIIYVLIRILLLLFKKQFRKVGAFILKTLIGFEIAYLIFYIFWGMNYFRPAAAERLGLADTSYSIRNVRDVTAMLIDSANSIRACLTPADFNRANQQNYQQAVSAIKKLGETSPHYKSYSPRIKPSLLSYFMNYMGTSGDYNPFTSEAQLNSQMPAFDIPFVACHEMSHQIGFAREDEANFVGFIAGIGSSDKLLKYSAYYAGVEEFMRFIRRRDTAARKELRLRISPLMILDFKADSAYWTKYEGKAEMISGLFYDRFLKVNNQPQGLHTYNRMIRLTMAYYRKKYRLW